MLSKKLGIDKAQAIGHLHLLWWWCCDYAPDGRLEKFMPDQIAEAAQWAGNAGEFLQHMADTGFIDRDPLRVHDWNSYRLHFDDIQARKERKLLQVRRRVSKWRKRTRNAPVTQCNAATDTTDTTDTTDITSVMAAQAPRPYPLPDPKTNPTACLVLAYKTRKGIPFDDRDWDKLNFSRCMKAAGPLLGLCGDLAVAQTCLDTLGAEYDDKNLTWTLETVARNAGEWLKKNGRTDASASRAGLRMAIAQRRTENQNSGGLAKVSGGPLLDAIRDGAIAGNRTKTDRD